MSNYRFPSELVRVLSRHDCGSHNNSHYNVTIDAELGTTFPVISGDIIMQFLPAY